MSELAQRNQAAFAELCRTGTYTEEQRHAERVVRFFRAVLSSVLPRLGRGRPPRVLDAGMGTGAWLEELVPLLADAGMAPTYYGFDFTPDMVSVAQRRMTRLGVPADLCQGDLAEAASYRFAQADRFELIVVFDVVQQLPRRRQRAAVDRVLDALAPGGVAVIFDQDRFSRFGLRMEFRKAVTRYLRVPLVPAYFTLARYPALGRIAARARSQGFGVEMRVMPDGPKRALVITRPGIGTA